MQSTVYEKRRDKIYDQRTLILQPSSDLERRRSRRRPRGLDKRLKDRVVASYV